MISLLTKPFKKIGFSLGSSRWLARKLVHESSIIGQSGITILELGGGKGNVTREIIKHLDSTSQLIVMEYDGTLYEELRNFEAPNIRILHGSAEDITNILPTSSVDVVISTLPFGSLGKSKTQSILSEIRAVLKHNGRFIQYQYWMTNFWDVKRFFFVKKIAFEPRNFTPAFIYVSQQSHD